MSCTHVPTGKPVRCMARRDKWGQLEVLIGFVRPPGDRQGTTTWWRADQIEHKSGCAYAYLEDRRS